MQKVQKRLENEVATCEIPHYDTILIHVEYFKMYLKVTNELLCKKCAKVEMRVIVARGNR